MNYLTAQVKGQTLVIILLGTSVALTVALAVSVRTISTLKQTTTSAQAQSALAAAEAGAEIALGRLKDGTCTGSEAACTTAEGNVITDPGYLVGSNTYYWFTIAKTGGSLNEPYLMDLAKDITQEVKLDTYSGNSVQVCWWDPSLDGTTEVANAVEMIYVEGTGPYTMKKYAYNGAGSSPNGFSTPPSIGSAYFPSSGKTVNFNHCQNIPSSGSMSSPKILRIKAFYSNFSAVVKPASSVALPAQGYQIKSYGKTADGSVRKAIRVTKSLPALPSIFDFGLYSGSTTQPLSK